jgi:CheY-like chemotaxis protein
MVIGRFSQTQVMRTFQMLGERARRMQLLAAMMKGGALAPGRAGRIACAELLAIEAHAERAQLESIAQLARPLRHVIEYVTAANQQGGVSHDVVVLESDEVIADLIALAVEAEGHSVRVADSLATCLELFHERSPDVILTEGRIPNAPVDQFCHFLRERVSQRTIPIIMFSDAKGMELQVLARNAGADRYVCKDQGIGELVAELNQVISEILW